MYGLAGEADVEGELEPPCEPHDTNTRGHADEDDPASHRHDWIVRRQLGDGKGLMAGRHAASRQWWRALLQGALV